MMRGRQITPLRRQPSTKGAAQCSLARHATATWHTGLLARRTRGRFGRYTSTMLVISKDQRFSTFAHASAPYRCAEELHEAGSAIEPHLRWGYRALTDKARSIRIMMSRLCYSSV